VQGNRISAFMSAVAGSGARVLMTGHWGDQVMFDQAYLVDALRECSWPMVRAHLDEYVRWFPDARRNAFTRRLVSDAFDHAAPGWARPAARRVRRIWQQPEWWQRMYTPRFCSAAGREGFRRQPEGGDRITALGSALYREARSKYHALCLENTQKQSAQHGVAVTFPFLDRDLLSFVQGVPGPILARGGVPKALLREAMRGIVPESIRTRRTKGDFTAIVARAAQQEFPRVRRLLAGEPLVVQFGYVALDALIAGLRLAERDLAQSESCVAAWRLADIVALELWLQEFFSGQRLEDVVDAPTTRQEQEPERSRGIRR
jgi:asparagine synthase (glutamine-hydrolysing)